MKLTRNFFEMRKNNEEEVGEEKEKDEEDVCDSKTLYLLKRQKHEKRIYWAVPDAV